MTRTRWTLFALAIAAGLTFSSPNADAGWPSGGVRTLPGQMCVWGFKLDTQPIYCPYVSSSDSYYAGSNQYIYVDYDVSSSFSGASTSAEACHQSYTGSAYVCGQTSVASGTGHHDLGVLGFASLGGTWSIYDYFYVTIWTSETIDNVYGVGYIN
jgi:hypothetical protein